MVERRVSGSGSPSRSPVEHRDDLALAPALATPRDAGEDLAQDEQVLVREVAPSFAVAAEAAGGRGVALAEVAENRRAMAAGRVGVRDHAGELAAVELAAARPGRSGARADRLCSMRNSRVRTST